MSNITASAAFDPRPYLRKLGGRDYLEVKFRLLWLRTDHPDSVIDTELVRLEGDFALFRARVAIPGAGVATGYGSETRQDFFDFIEKAETKAVGRALAALGFGTQFCEDFETMDVSGSTHPVDSPVEPRQPAMEHSGTEPTHTSSDPRPIGSGLATPAQLKLIYLTATRDVGIDDQELEARCQERYGREPMHLTKREASEFIDALKAAGTARVR